MAILVERSVNLGNRRDHVVALTVSCSPFGSIRKLLSSPAQQQQQQAACSRPKIPKHGGARKSNQNSSLHGKTGRRNAKKKGTMIYIHIYLQADPQRVRTRWRQVKSFVPKNLSEKVLADVKVGQAAHSPCSEPNMQARVLAIVFIAQH